MSGEWVQLIYCIYSLAGFKNKWKMARCAGQTNRIIFFMKGQMPVIWSNYGFMFHICKPKLLEQFRWNFGWCHGSRGGLRKTTFIKKSFEPLWDYFTVIISGTRKTAWQMVERISTEVLKGTSFCVCIQDRFMNLMINAKRFMDQSHSIAE